MTKTREEKKQKTLSRSLINQAFEASQEESTAMLEKIVDGSYVKKANAHFIASIENGERKFFLQKANQVDTQFGIGLARILSDKKFALKRQTSFLQEGKIVSAIKWDHQITSDGDQDQFFLDKFEIIDQYKTAEFHKKYARLCAVLYVFGDADYNDTNFLVSRKTGNPLRIDWNPLSNEIILASDPQARFRIYGSAQAEYLLTNRFVTGKNNNNLFFNRKKSLLTNKNSELSQNKITIADYAQFHFNLNSQAPNQDLLQRIEKYITQQENQQIQEEFIEFMQGIKDAIALAQDDVFLNAYTQKFQTELSQTAYEIALICRDFFKENAKTAQEQFKDFIKLSDKLLQARAEKDPDSVAVKPKAAAAAEKDSFSQGNVFM